MDKIKFIKNTFAKIIGLKARNVLLGYGSFITMDFGKDIIIEVETNKGIDKFPRGEWHLWIYMTAWRIDEKMMPIAGCEDSRVTIEKALKKIENKKLINVDIRNHAFDMKIEFENDIIINLFTLYTEKDSDSENWMLFTPEKKVLAVGPGSFLEYKKSGK